MLLRALVLAYVNTRCSTTRRRLRLAAFRARDLDPAFPAAPQHADPASPRPPRVTWAHHALSRATARARSRRWPAASGSSRRLPSPASSAMSMPMPPVHLRFNGAALVPFTTRPCQPFRRGRRSRRIYGSTFFMATGFHASTHRRDDLPDGVCLGAPSPDNSNPDAPFRLRAAAWYWHFVDVVWLFLIQLHLRAGAGAGHLLSGATHDALYGRCRAAARAAVRRLSDAGAPLRPLRPRLCGVRCGRRPRVSVVLIVGAIVCRRGAYVEFTYSPPYWVHAVLWIPTIVILSFVFLRLAKSLLIGAAVQAQGGRGEARRILHLPRLGR